MKLKWIIPIVLLLAAIGVGLRFTVFNQKTVVTTKATHREAVHAVYASGAMRAERMAVLRPEVGGQVKTLTVKRGEEVLQGTTVLEIDVKEEQDAVLEQTSRVRESAVDLSRYQVDIDDAKTNLEKEKRLLEQGATTQQAVDDAATKLERAQSAYSKASAAVSTARTTLTTRRNRVGRGKLTAPITGVVTQLNVNLGDNIPANIDAITIIDPSSYRIYADVDELDISKIQVGQEAYVAFDAVPDARYLARVERIVRLADPVTKALTVILQLMEVPATIADGLTATVNVLVERHPNALTIPAGALVPDSAGTPAATARTRRTARVFVLGAAGDKLESRTVEYGIRGEDYVEVLKGVDEQDRIVLNPQSTWKDGDKVAVSENKK